MLEKVRKVDDRFFWLALAATPFIMCVIVCALQGHLISDYYFPSSHWNDEIVYYKQVEGIVNFGMPLGYFGYNESHAEIGTCATWSPALCIVWVIFGKIFTWNLLSPIVFNILWISICLLLFAVIVKADKRQCIHLMVLYSTFLTFTRFCLSCLSDISCYGWIIIFVALAYRLVFMNGNNIILACSIFVNWLLVLMRPYFLVFTLIPIVVSYKKFKNKVYVVLGSVIITGFYVVSYYIVYNKLCASYFIDLIRYEWLKTLINEGIVSGFNEIVILFGNSVSLMVSLMKQAVLTGKLEGIHLITSLIILVFVLRKAKKSKKTKIWLFFWAGYYFAILFASIFLFEIYAGSKHMVTFVVAGSLVLALEETVNWKEIVIIAALFLIFFVPLGNYSVNMWLPFHDENVQAALDEFEKFANKNIVISKDNDKWDNTVNWVLEDEVDGNIYSTRWQMFYGLPKGVGLNIVQKDWTINEFSNLKSKYLFTVSRGSVAQKCIAENKKVLYEGNGMILFELNTN